jgi:hypothetical protein
MNDNWRRHDAEAEMRRLRIEGDRWRAEADRLTDALRHYHVGAKAVALNEQAVIVANAAR